MKYLILSGLMFSILSLSACAGSFVKPDASDTGFAARMMDRR